MPEFQAIDNNRKEISRAGTPVLGVKKPDTQNLRQISEMENGVPSLDRLPAP
jgi:hypothetical protein